MAKKKTSKRNTSDEQTAVLRRLTQSSASYLLGKSTSWIRDNPHRFNRNRDGSYDGRDLLAAARRELEPVTLDDDELEPLMHLAELLADGLGSKLPAAIRMVEQIEAKHGGAGLAAVADVLRDHWKLYILELGQDYFTLDTPDEIRDQAEERIKRLPDEKAQRELRAVYRCDGCERIRKGRKWADGNVPKGYAVAHAVCPKCE